MVGGPKQVITAGSAFSPLRFGLLSAAQEIPDPTDQWKNGTIWQADPCQPATTTSFDCPPGTGSPKLAAATGTAIGVTAAEPFTVVAWLPCAPIAQGRDLADLRGRTERLLDRGEGRAVEQVFWTGVAGATGQYTIRPHLADDTQVLATEGVFAGVELQSAATVVTGVPLNTVQALGALEGALGACYGGEGVIHVPRAALAHLASKSLIASMQGGQMRTHGGNLIAAYAANNRHGPSGTEPAAGQAWFYATGAVWYRRSTMTTPGMRPGDYVGRTQNETVYVAERTYVVDWDCCHFAAQVALTGGT